MEKHKIEVERISKEIKSYKSSESGKKLRFDHGSTNSTKPKNTEKYFYIDTSSLNRVILVDPDEKFVLVEPSVSMDLLVEQTLKHNLIPQVVMEFPGITVGGAIQGAALESSSFKFGQFNTGALEYEIITAEGELMKASPSENSELFYGVTGSYGSLGLLTLIKLKLIPAKKYVEVSYQQVNSFKQAIDFIHNETNSDADYVDGIMFGPEKGAIIIGRLADKSDCKIQTFTKPSDPWFYKHAEESLGKTELVPIVDYFFRYNRGSFWMGDFFFKLMKIPGRNNKFNRTLFNPFLNTRKLYEVLHSMNWTHRFFIQDIYFPISRVLEYLNYVEQKLKIYPIWLCPLKNTTHPEKLSPNYLSSDLIVNVGIWGIPSNNSNLVDLNRDVEVKTEELGGRKMFYAQTFYPEEEFWKIYDYDWYKRLRHKYRAEEVFPDIYEKVYVSGKYKETTFVGFWKLLWSFISMKNLNS